MTVEELIEFNSDELYHHGVKGQKWGVRRTLQQLGYSVKAKFSNPEKAAAKARAKSIRAASKVRAKALIEKRKNDKIISKAQEKADAKLRKAKGEKYLEKQAKKIIKKEQRQAEKEAERINKERASKELKSMTDDELRVRISRLENEQKYRKLTGTEEKPKEDGFVKSLWKQGIKPGAITAGKNVTEKYVTKKLTEILDLDSNKIEKQAKTIADQAKKIKELQSKKDTKIDKKKYKLELAKVRAEIKSSKADIARSKAQAMSDKTWLEYWKLRNKQ